MQEDIYQRVHQHYLRAIGEKSNWSAFVWRQIRKVLLKWKDPAIKCEVFGHELIMPASHELGKYLLKHPLYMKNLAYLSGLVEAKYPGSLAFDIGANIGDTAAVIRSTSNLKVLCVEGNPYFIGFLKSNLSTFEHVFIAETFVGTGHAIKGNLVTKEGTAIFLPSENGTNTEFKSLTSIYESLSVLDHVQLIKVDTDGFDLDIIAGNIDFMETFKPVLFFEYGPDYFLPHNPTIGKTFFQTVLNAGYTKGMEFDNFGRYIQSFEVSEEAGNLKLLDKFTNLGKGQFCDIMLFHQKDEDLSEKMIALSKQHLS